MKFCRGCKETKDLSEFGKNRRTKDGLQYLCKECIIEQKKKYEKTVGLYGQGGKPEAFFDLVSEMNLAKGRYLGKNPTSKTVDYDEQARLYMQEE